jgi:hypothetical protein
MVLRFKVFSKGFIVFKWHDFWIETQLGKYFILEFVIVNYWSSWIEVWVWKCYLLLPICAQFYLFVHAF